MFVLINYICSALLSEEDVTLRLYAEAERSMLLDSESSYVLPLLGLNVYSIIGVNN